MSHPRYNRYNRYYSEPELVDRLIKSNWKLPRGKAGRPAKVSRLWSRGLIVYRDDLILSAWYGAGEDFALCQALAISLKHPKPAVRRQAHLAILNRISQALNKKDPTIFHRLADSIKAVQSAPRHPLAVAITLAHIILTREGNEDPKPADLVRKAGERFPAPGPATELDSLNASLFREAKRFLAHLKETTD